MTLPDITGRVDEESLRLHEAAEAIIAARNRARGKAPTDYDIDEYYEVLEEAQAGGPFAASLRMPDLERALRELGLPVPGEPTVVTPGLLSKRADEILEERGFIPYGVDPTGGSKRPSEEERVDAYKQAIAELGAPGEPRKDLEENQGVRKTALLVAAIEQQTITSYEARSYAAMYDANPPATVGLLKAKGLKVPATVETPPSLRRDPVIAAAARTFESHSDVFADDEGLVLHVAAEELLRGAGLFDEWGKPAYDHHQYMKALEAAGNIVEGTDRSGVAELLARTSKSLAESGRLSEFRADEYLDHASTAARRIAFEREEQAQDAE